MATDLLLVLADVDGGTGQISKQEETDMGPKVHEHMTERLRCVTPRREYQRPQS